MTKSKKLDALVGSVEDLLARLPDDLTPELAALRDKVDAGIFDAWTAVAQEGWDSQARVKRLAAARLWSTVGAAVFAAAASLIAYRMTRPANR
jgi:hypothetical protein